MGAALLGILRSTVVRKIRRIKGAVGSFSPPGTEALAGGGVLGAGFAAELSIFLAAGFTAKISLFLAVTGGFRACCCPTIIDFSSFVPLNLHSSTE